METRGTIDTISKNEFLDDYRRLSDFQDISRQIRTVNKFISLFSSTDNLGVDEMFIEYFPKDLLLEFNMMIVGGMDDISITRIEILLFDVFTFIFRNRNLVTNSYAQSFIKIFLRYIKNKDRKSTVYSKRLVNSVIHCVSHEQNKVIFIDENGLLSFYFVIPAIKFSKKFWKLCKQVYNLDREYVSSLSRSKLRDNINQIINNYCPTSEEYRMLVFAIFRMLHRFRLLDEVEFIVDQLYDMTESTLLNHIDKRDIFYPKYLPYLSKIWSGILNASKNKIQIDTFDRLAVFAALFSIDLSKKLNKLSISGKFVITKNTKQRYYVIYLTLIAFPIIDHDEKPWLFKAFSDLHHSFQRFIQKKKINFLRTENQFIIMQYYVKSHEILDLQISIDDCNVLETFYDRLVRIPLLKLHSCYLAVHCIFRLPRKGQSNDSHTPENLNKIKIFLHWLIASLSDEKYINKIQNNQKLYLYEHIKTCALSGVNDDLITMVFSKLESKLLNDVKKKSSDDLNLVQYQIYKEIMSMVVNSLNESNFLDKKMAEYFVKCLKENSDHLSPNECNTNKSDSLAISTSSTQEDKLQYQPIRLLFTWFKLIFELKFMFGDITSKSVNLEWKLLI
ncbi:hypothetical protein RF11_04458 [Thelohanellus kitauei]|uniref:Uncharacterized protein n=1 Tax=Thelohanellus kitauei TaxID=669202 RepID=A0A0C2JIU1_THEKT|nr:hypothetical protein RF11_04458 [Thelohanellus kitauei]